jgi:sugar transferase (PEP-CTERM system associated)
LNSFDDPQQPQAETDTQRSTQQIPGELQEPAALRHRKEGKKKMIRVFNHYLHRRTLMQVLFDFGFIIAAVLGAVLSQVQLSSAMSHAVVYGALLALSMFVINTATGFYDRTPNRTLNQSCARAVLALLLVLGLEYFFNGLLPATMPNRDAIKWAALLGVVAVVAHRVYVSHWTSQTRSRTRIMVFGSGPAAALVGKTLKANDPNAEVVGYFPGVNEGKPAVPMACIFRKDQSLAQAALSLDIDEIVVALTERRGGSMPMLELLDCKVKGIRVYDIATHFEKTLSQIKIEYLNAGWLIFGDGFNQGWTRTFGKRLVDIVGSLILLAVSLPCMLVTALLIVLESKGPILYRQERVGLNGKTFNVIKFRSMRTDAEKDGKPQWARLKDDRVTRIGQIIRKLRIDELPQIFCVLKGDMSLVGPRPERPYFVDKLTQEIPFYAVRHSVKPGVTGWAQVRYHYGATVDDSREKLQYDLYYVKNHTLFLDLLVLFETVAVVLLAKGSR